MWFWLIVLFVLAVFYTIASEWKGKNRPPGVRGFRSFPLVVRLIRDGTYRTCNYLTDTYGDFVNIQFPGTNLFILGTERLLKEAFAKSELSDRPEEVATGGLVRANGQVWKEHRRFALSTLRDMGMGKSVMEKRIGEECEDLVRALGSMKGSFDPRFYIGCATTNIICAMMFSERYSYGDPHLRKLWDALAYLASAPERLIGRVLPFGSLLPSLRAGEARLRGCFDAIADNVADFMKKHEETFQEGHIRDYVDAYLSVMKQQGEDSTFTMLQLKEAGRDMFMAGSETSNTTLRWAIALLAINDDVQTRVYEEIVEVIGKDRQVTMNDKINMPYTEAVMLEVQRYGSIAPHVLHRAIVDTEVAGYFIPCGSIVMCNLKKISEDGRVWPHPHEFNVANFYKDGEVINRQHVIAFSLGKRSCIGESLAKMEVFMLFVSMFQRFHFSFEPGEAPDLDDATLGVIRSPKSYKVLLQDRA